MNVKLHDAELNKLLEAQNKGASLKREIFERFIYFSAGYGIVTFSYQIIGLF